MAPEAPFNFCQVHPIRKILVEDKAFLRHIVSRMKSARARQAGEWALLIGHYPGDSAQPIGVLLRDAEHDLLWVKFKDFWWTSWTQEDCELWTGLVDYIDEKAHDWGARRVLDWLERDASHVLQVGLRREISFHDSAATLANLYVQYVSTPGALERAGAEKTILADFTSRPAMPVAPNWNKDRSLAFQWKSAAIAASFAAIAILAGLKLEIPTSRKLESKAEHPFSLPFCARSLSVPVLLNLQAVAEPTHLLPRHWKKLRRTPSRTPAPFRINFIAGSFPATRIPPPVLSPSLPLDLEVHTVTWIPSQIALAPALPS